MEIKLHEITVRELFKGYKNSNEEGVVAYDGCLDVRPKYQREFVYNDDKRDAVIDTLWKNFPLNVMYWVKRDEGGFEVLDGQQRTISICEYIEGNFSVNIEGNPMYFHTLTDNQQERLLNYKLMVYFCEGSDSEKLDWFKIINIAGEKLSDQELLNAIYTGEWLTDAKRHFSSSACPAKGKGEGLVDGKFIRQEVLETVLKWISTDGKPQSYMAAHQKDKNANELWQYYQSVIDWAWRTFPEKRREMKNLPWGTLYNKYHTRTYDSDTFEKRIAQLMQDDDVQQKKGIYEYLLSNDEKHLNIRQFTESQKRTAYEKQKGICHKCKKHFDFNEMEGDHIKPWSEGGKTLPDNLQMLCKECNRRKSNQ